MHTNVSKNIKPYYKAIYSTAPREHSVHTAQHLPSSHRILYLNRKSNVQNSNEKHRLQSEMYISFLWLLLLLLLLLFLESVFLLLLVMFCSLLARSVHVWNFCYHDEKAEEMGFWCANAAMCTLESSPSSSLCVLCVELWIILLLCEIFNGPIALRISIAIFRLLVHQRYTSFFHRRRHLMLLLLLLLVLLLVWLHFHIFLHPVSSSPHLFHCRCRRRRRSELVCDSNNIVMHCYHFAIAPTKEEGKNSTHTHTDKVLQALYNNYMWCC